MYKTCATKKNTKQYYTPKCLISYLLSSFFFFCQVFLLIFQKAGKVKRLEKRSACSRPVKQAIFFTVQNNQLYNTAGRIFVIHLCSFRALSVLYFVAVGYNFKIKDCALQLKMFK